MKLLLFLSLVAAVTMVHTLPSVVRKDTKRDNINTAVGSNSGIAVGEPHPKGNNAKEESAGKKSEDKKKDYKMYMMMHSLLKPGKGVQFNSKQTAQMCLGEDSEMYKMYRKTIEECNMEMGFKERDMDSREEEEEEAEMQSRKKGNQKMSRCERKEHMIKKMKLRSCIVDKMGWVSKDGMVNMKKLKSSFVSSNMEDMFMKKSDKKIAKCMEIVNTVEVEKKLMNMMDVERCQRDQVQELVKERIDMSNNELHKQMKSVLSLGCINQAYMKICKAYIKVELISEDDRPEKEDGGEGGDKKKPKKSG